jgi:hypothetical protein
VTRRNELILAATGALLVLVAATMLLSGRPGRRPPTPTPRGTPPSATARPCATRSRHWRPSSPNEAELRAKANLAKAEFPATPALPALVDALQDAASLSASSRGRWPRPPPRPRRRWYGLSGCSDRPVFQTGDPEVVPILPLPTTNTAIKAETDRAAGKTGCLYNGPTRIVLNSNGTMTVTSPFTTSSAYASCVGTNVPCPPTGSSTSRTWPRPRRRPAPAARTGSATRSPGDATSYGCRDGDAFLSGTLRGRLTIATENNVVIVANTTYSSTGAASTDMLGLVANQFVQVYHPVNSSGEQPVRHPQPDRDLHQPPDPRGHAGPRPLLHRPELRRGRPAGHDHRQRRDRPEVARPGRDLGRHRLPRTTATTPGSSTPRRRTSWTSPRPLPGQPVGEIPNPTGLPF